MLTRLDERCDVLLNAFGLWDIRFELIILDSFFFGELISWRRAIDLVDVRVRVMASSSCIVCGDFQATKANSVTIVTWMNKGVIRLKL